MSAGVAVYRLYNEVDELLYVGMGVDPEERFRFHAKFKPWWPEVARRDVRWHPDRTIALREEAEAITSEHPRYNVMQPGDGGSARGSSHRAGVPASAVGASPPQSPNMRNARVADDVWLQALAKAEAQGETASDAVTHGLRMYAAEPLPSAYDFTFANWPEVADWHAKRSAAFAALESELSAATGFLDPEWLAIAVWLASTHHPADAAQAKRVITGHILRRAMSGDYADAAGWRDKYRDSRHLSETVQAILERHLPLGEG